MNTLRIYLIWPIFFTILGLVGAFVLGLRADGMPGGLSFLLIGGLLAVLEISLSFDNAIVNANKLQTMTPEWQRRFLTWGILIAVFGMRIIFPLAVVAIAAQIGPISALMLAATEPDTYAQIMEDSHLSISAFGGTFLMMVALSYFVDADKDVHWFEPVERRLCHAGRLSGVAIALVLGIVLAITVSLPSGEGAAFLFAAICGIVTFLAVELLGDILDSKQAATAGAARGGLGAFLYLEVLDASFSFDGVIGAFALTQNLFLIAIGLGIGAFYVRSMTIMLVERQTLTEFRYLEHGAFYSILALSLAMFAQALVHVPEILTGLVGATLIGLALWSSLRVRAAAANSS
ncbi:DUF475 domain-containing protein [Loktanella sp. SALINAS62]|uniref:DUF475 domain-containing protein n=1 Tax=Loktanella sp. SALINAS62 TaxID=2706124 RepID=UPI001B8C4F34|nr:DUF475 domain-containing protein [Loktanella sp. SALINAS62]MBS1302651.1 DUF475 domain-containing protein [Loktanella sp. SALINAS62]